MRLFQNADVIALTGLSKSQLREWTGRGRRELLQPDVEASGPGRHALYTWQTVLVLRVLLALHRDYAAEVGAWAPAARMFRERLETAPFLSLRHLSAIFLSRSRMIIAEATDVSVRSGGIVVPLSPHLTELAERLPLPQSDQLPLFPPTAVGK